LRRRRWKRKMSAAERRKGGLQYTVEALRGTGSWPLFTEVVVASVHGAIVTS